MTDRSDAAATPAADGTEVELSFAVLSFGDPVIEAVFVNVNEPVVVSDGAEPTCAAAAVLTRAARVPRLQVTVAVPVQEPCDADDDTKLVPAGIVSDTV